MPQISNRSFIDIPGVGRLRTKEGSSIDVGGESREAVTDEQGNVHYIVKIVPAVIECTVLHGKDTDIEALRAIASQTVTFATDTGSTYSVAGAFLTNTPKLGSGGEIPLNFQGQPAVKVK